MVTKASAENRVVVHALDVLVTRIVECAQRVSVELTRVALERTLAEAVVLDEVAAHELVVEERRSACGLVDAHAQVAGAIDSFLQWRQVERIALARASRQELSAQVDASVARVRVAGMASLIEEESSVWVVLV